MMCTEGSIWKDSRAAHAAGVAMNAPKTKVSAKMLVW
jgi:hypothetical protein